MQIKDLHSWNLTYSQARDCQKSLAPKVRFTPLKQQPRLIAGIDCAFSKNGKKIIAAVVVLKPPDFTPVETAYALRKVTFPYIPGLLSFREAPACIAAVRKLKTEPDVFIVDGQGIAHPRRLGLAAHLGLFFDKPTIGCAKSRLTGYFHDPPPEKGTYSFLRDKKSTKRKASHESRATGDEIIGAVVRTRTNVKPLYVSVGNRCLLENAINIILGCTTKYRLPEPTRLAHQMVGILRLKA
ncbi:MAG: deoxyribonuclease V [Phycisphaerae bacterium]|nr:deoxyribonuclease V [Phycisphaerae bacterium]